MPSANTLIKDPDESQLYSVDFVNLLASGESLSTVSSVTSSPSDLTISGETISGTKVVFRAAAGSSGSIYDIIVTVTTSNSNTKQDCVKLLVQSCPWMYTMIRGLRHLINDAADESTYTDFRLAETIVLASQHILGELTFNNSYTANIGTLTLSPDPVGLSDLEFINLVLLKAACIIDLATARAKAGVTGISVRDSMGSISTGGAMDGYKFLLQNKNGNCELYREAKKQYQFGNTQWLRAILGPFSGPNISTYNVGDDLRNRDLFN